MTISILLNLTKMFEKCMFKQISHFWGEYRVSVPRNVFWKFQKSGIALSIIINCDCLNHKLLIEKLNAYGFSSTALKLVHNYLSNRKQQTDTNSLYSSWLDIYFGFHKGNSRASLIQYFLTDLLFKIEDNYIASYVDGNKPCASIG